MSTNLVKTAVFLISKNEHCGQIYFVESDIAIPFEFLQLLGNDPDTFLFVNPKNEWHEIQFIKAQVITYHPGVTDNSAIVLKNLINTNLPNIQIYNIHSGIMNFDFNDKINSLIQNEVITSKIELINGINLFPLNVSMNRDLSVCEFNFKDTSIDELEKLSKENKWALSNDELKTLKNYFSSEEYLNHRKTSQISINPTDLEIEIFAQTWSEHCKHKIFNAKIEYSDNEQSFTVDSIYKTFIKGPTFKLNKPWAVSVFNDNAGVVDWDEENYFAIKVETHNSPSALDPYGGALTGILGVNRDILGTGLGFSPVANTNVFCVGLWDEDYTLPTNIIHPKNILKGIHKGIQDGGNKSGIPTVNGAICFDENFTGKPLVYCGTIGIAPKFSKSIIDNKNKYHEAGDLIIMAGGRVGLDGIHGATMSSIALDETVPKTMVQIGDPFTQKKLGDFVLYCRDRGILKGLTDNGAGGLSSSIGEMAERTNGAKVYLEKVPLKYNGLRPWEIFVSESQERMSLAIAKENLDEVLLAAKHFGVEVSNVGEFTNTGFLEILNNNNLVASIDLDFLHNGLPRMNLTAHWSGPLKEIPTFKQGKHKKLPFKNHFETLKCLMSDRNIGSKEYFIKQYDHEVKAATIVKPIEGIHSKHNSPNDSGVIWLKPHGGNSSKALAISSGLQYHFSHLDSLLMAKLSFDEAVRGVVASGANPKKIAVTDNFCWPDPLESKNNPDASYKLAQLVRASMGISYMSLSYEIPMISGKDSMKNDYINENLKISVPPTLLMTAMGLVEDVNLLKKSFIKNENQLVYRIGLDFGKDYFGHFFNKYFKIENNPNFKWDLNESISFYNTIHENLSLIQSCHDVSEGGLLVTLMESLFLKKLGINFENEFSIEELYSEYPTHFVVSVNLEDQQRFETVFAKHFKFIGKTTADGKVIVSNEQFKTSDIESSWRLSW